MKKINVKIYFQRSFKRKHKCDGDFEFNYVSGKAKIRIDTGKCDRSDIEDTLAHELIHLYECTLEGYFDSRGKTVDKIYSKHSEDAAKRGAKELMRLIRNAQRRTKYAEAKRRKAIKKGIKRSRRRKQ